MASLERLNHVHLTTDDPVLAESVRLHFERYAFAAGFARDRRVLDIACGTGYGSDVLAAAPASQVVGIDVDPEAIDEAARLYSRDHVAFFQSDYRALASEAEMPPALRSVLATPFDLIVSLETIEHLEDPDDFLRTLSRFLRPGGTIVASVPITPSVDVNPFHLHDFTSASFHHLLERNGFTVVDSLRQRQPYNPVKVRGALARAGRTEFRSNLAGYYRANPGALWTRIASTLRHGFVNLVEVVAVRPAPMTE